MKKVFEVIIKRPVTICTIVILLIVFGVMTVLDLPVNLVPEMSVAMVGVVVGYPGASSTQVQEKINDKTEEGLKSVAGITKINSMAVENMGVCLATFDYNVDVDLKKKEVEEAIKSVEYPTDAYEPKFLTVNFNKEATASFAVASSDLSKEDLEKEVEELKNRFLRIEGVSNVSYYGLSEAKVKIRGIEGLDLSVGLVASALLQEGYDIPLGMFFENGEEIALKNSSDVASLAELKNLPLTLPISHELLTKLTLLKNFYDFYTTSSAEEVEDYLNDIILITSATSNDNEDLGKYLGKLILVKALMAYLDYASVDEIDALWNDYLKPVAESATLATLSEERIKQISSFTGISEEFIKLFKEKALNGDLEKIFEDLKNFKTLYSNPSVTDYTNLFTTGGAGYINQEGVDVLLDYDGFNLFPDLETSEVEALINKVDAFSLLSLNDTSNLLQDINETTPLTESLSKVSVEELKEDLRKLIEYKKQDYSSESFAEVLNSLNLLSAIGFDFSINPRMLDLMEDSAYAVYESENEVKLIIPLDYLATVELYDDYSSYASYNGKQAVIVELYTNNDANTTKVVKAAKKALKNNSILQEEIINDKAAFISDSISNILASMIIGGVLAIVVIYLFIRKIRSSIIIGVTMPLSVLTSFILLWCLKIDANMVSIGGLAIGVGMLVDNSIVVLESITKYRENGFEIFDACVLGTKEVALSLLAATLTNICVFIPILFLTGLTKIIFYDLVFSILFSMGSSLICALFVIPTLYKLFYKDGKKDKEPPHKILRFFESIYEKLLKGALRKKGLVFILALVVFLSSLFMLFAFDYEFLPPVDKGQIQINVGYLAGTTLEEEKQTSDNLSNILQAMDGVQMVSYSVGFHGLTATASTTQFAIQIDNKKYNTIDYTQKIRERLSGEAGFSSLMVVAMDGVVEELVGSIAENSIYIKSDNFEEMIAGATRAKELLQDYDGIVSANCDYLNTRKQINLKIDKFALAKYNLDYTTTVALLRVGIASQDVKEVNIDGNLMKVNLEFNDSSKENIADILNIIIGMSDDEPIKLGAVATIEEKEEYTALGKEDGKYLASIDLETYNLTSKDLDKVIADLQGTIEVEHPEVSVEKGGIGTYLDETFNGLIVVLIFGFILLFAIMSCQFESLIKPFIIIMSIPFGITGALLALLITNQTINVISLVGIIMLLGVMVNDAIVLVDKINYNIANGMAPLDAIISGTKNRFRAVLMTSFTTILALIPLSLGLGKGGKLMQPMGIAVLGGLLFGTFITLIIIPCFYAIIKRVKTK